MGTDRNSYSKTDLDATFMRMKEDHMMNGQLKPAYNVQFAVENYFIVHIYLSNDRTDYNTLEPVIEKHKHWLETPLKEFVADSGYCSEKNLNYLKDNNIESFIKLQEHEKKKTRKYHQEVGKYYNMEVVEFDEVNDRVQSYKCHDGRLLSYNRTENQTKAGVKRVFEVYNCQSCKACTLKSKCLYKYDEEKDFNKNRELKVNYNWDELKKKSEEKVYKEMLFYTFGRNLIK